MKRINLIISVCIAILPLLSCKKENIEKGLPEDKDCLGVFFPNKQKNFGNNELEASDPTTFKFVIQRVIPEGKTAAELPEIAKVPIEIKDTGKVFKVSDIKFEAGKDKTEFTVDFSDAMLGRKYGLEISVEDPHYAYLYRNMKNTISLSVVRILWNKLDGKAKYRDDIFSSKYPTLSGRFAETDVEIEERDDKPGIFRLVNLYSEQFMEALVGGTSSDCKVKKGHKIIIDASDSTKVKIPYQSTGVSLKPADGELWFASYSPDYFSKAKIYGTLKKNVIEFPKSGFVMGTEAKPSAFGNTSGKFRLILPEKKK